MDETISLYRIIEEPVVVFHNRNVLPPINVPHLHSRYEFCYNIGGAHGMLTDQKYIPCNGRDLVFLPKTCVHKILVHKGEYYERCVVNVDSSVVEEINSLPHLNRPLDWLESPAMSIPRRVNLSEEAHRRFVKLVDLYHKSEQSKLSQYGIFLQIMDFLEVQFRNAAACELEVSMPETFAERALLLIEENFADMKVSDLSKKLYVNAAHLSALFKDEYGITLEQYLLIRKIAEAKKYLYMGESVTEACARAGFRNYSNFVRTFKKVEGCTPSRLHKLTDPL